MRWMFSFLVITILVFSLLATSCEAAPSNSKTSLRAKQKIMSLPPEPRLPGEAQKQASIAGRAFYSELGRLGYADPGNVFTINKDSLTKGELLTLSVTEDHIYKHYYVSEWGKWVKYTFPQQTIGNSNWIAFAAGTSVSTGQLPEGDNYVVVYSCSKTSKGFDCHNHKWQIHQFQLLKEPEIPAPELTCAMINCSPGYVCVDAKCVPPTEPKAPPPPEQKEEMKFYPTGEVFVGPLVGWKNVKINYGAVGDGTADDTPAIQNALNDLQQMKFTVLYLPSGTYRITSALNLPQVAGKPNGVKIVGEDPETTTIVWDGPANGSMFLYNPWYTSLGRITFDGQGKAGKIIEHGLVFAVWNEYFDLVFKNADICLDAGNLPAGGAGIADSVIIRSKFIGCKKAGVHISNFNSLQWGIYDSFFKDNGISVTNGGLLDLKGQGNFHIYRSVFMNSTFADVSIGNTGFFTVRDSVSIGSNAFYIATVIGNPAQVTLQRNTIIDPRGDTDLYFINKNGVTVPIAGCGTTTNKDIAPICSGNKGTVILLDNVIRTKDGYLGPIVKNTGVPGGFLSVGNTYMIQNWFKGSPESRYRSINDKVVSSSAIPNVTPELAATPPKTNSPVIEVSPGADAATIQQAIDTAVLKSNQTPVVHLQAGAYFINKTLVIPPYTDLQLVGDGLMSATRIGWRGGDGSPMLRIESPSEATIREITFLGRNTQSQGVADGIAISGDQPGSKIRLNQVLAKTQNKVGFFIDKLQNTGVEVSNSGVGGGIAVQVRGIGINSPPVTLMGEGGFGDNITFDIEDANVLIRDYWTEGRAWLTPKYAQIKGESTVTFHNTNNDHPRSTDPDKISTIVDGITGKASFIGTFSSASAPNDPRKPADISLPADVIGEEDPQFNSVPAIQIQGNNPNTKAALIGSAGWGENYFKNVSEVAQVARIFSNLLTRNLGQIVTEPLGKVITGPLADFGLTSDTFILDMLEQTRNTGSLSYHPAATSDIRLHRVVVDSANRGYVFTPTPTPIATIS